MDTQRRNIIASIIVLILFAVIGYVILSRTNILGRLRQAAPTPTPAPLDQEIDSDVNLFASPTAIPQLFPTSSPSATLRPLATASASPVAQCSNLTATPTTGTEPLSVRFTAVGLPASVREYEFDFGSNQANNVVRTQNLSTSFTYDSAGTYNASLKVYDAQGNQVTSLQNCFRTITVLAKPDATGAPKGGSLPKTGPEALILFALAPIAGVGAYLYKKFKLA